MAFFLKYWNSWEQQNKLVQSLWCTPPMNSSSSASVHYDTLMSWDVSQHVQYVVSSTKHNLKSLIVKENLNTAFLLQSTAATAPVTTTTSSPGLFDRTFHDIHPWNEFENWSFTTTLFPQGRCIKYFITTMLTHLYLKQDISNIEHWGW